MKVNSSQFRNSTIGKMTCTLQQKSALVMFIRVNMKHHILILLTLIISNNAVDPFEKQFDDVDNWLYTMQAYLSSSPISQVAGKMGPIRWNEVGLAGYAIIDVWLHYHCKLQNSGEKINACVRCYDTENATEMVACTAKYLPDDFMPCWDIEEVITYPLLIS